MHTMRGRTFGVQARQPNKLIVGLAVTAGIIAGYVLGWVFMDTASTVRRLQAKLLFCCCCCCCVVLAEERRAAWVMLGQT